jgi:hypothetical protein
MALPTKARRKSASVVSREAVGAMAADMLTFLVLIWNR